MLYVEMNYALQVSVLKFMQDVLSVNQALVIVLWSDHDKKVNFF